MRHSFGETEPLEGLLTDAGFRDVGSRTLSRKVRFADDERARIVETIVRGAPK